MKLICSTCHPWYCRVTPRVRLRDTYWSSVRDRARMRYWSVTSVMRLNSKMQSVPSFVSVDSRNTRTSGLRLQNLVCATDSLVCTDDISFSSDCVKGRLISCFLVVFHIEFAVICSHLSSSWNSSVSSFQIVSRFFSPEIHMNLHLKEDSLASSPWISQGDWPLS